MVSRLAIEGGSPVRRPERSWPVWPRYTEAARCEVDAALKSGRWAISGLFTGELSRNQRFAECFAAFLRAGYCVPVCNGSAALLIAMEALGVRPEDEVVVPGLTWVANASSVLRANAVPILADVEPDTLCLSVEAARRALSPRTRAICVVHLYGSMADMDAFRALADEAGVALIEDVSHEHGAMWRDSYAGTLGDIGVFSMQQSKLLTAGEGGAAVTNNPDLARRLEQLRADGRMLRAEASVGELELEEVGEVVGANFNLSELQAALLIEGLTRLEGENRRRERNARRLDAEFAELPGTLPIAAAPEQTRRAYYCYVLRLDLKRLGRRPVDQIAAVLGAELGFPVERVYRPLHDHPLYQPVGRPAMSFSPSYHTAIDPKRFDLPECERAWAECITLDHRLLLGDEQDMADVVSAFHKVWEHYAS